MDAQQDPCMKQYTHIYKNILLYNPYTSSHPPVYLKSSLGDLQYLIQHKYYVNSCKYNVNAIYSCWPGTNSNFDLGNFLKFFSQVFMIHVYKGLTKFSSVQLLSRVRLFVTPWTVAHQASLSIHQVLELAQTHARRVSDAIQSSHPLSSPSPAFSFSQHQGLFK